MKRLLPLFLLVLTLFSCKKEQVTTAGSMQFDFALSAAVTPEIFAGNTLDNLGAVITRTEGNAEVITLTVSGLPAGVSFNPALPKDYAASLFAMNSAATLVLPPLVVSGSARAGTYPVVLTAATASGISKSVTMNLVIKTCSIQNENTAQGTYKGSWNILSIPALADTITISNFLNIPDQKVLLATKALSPLIFTATVSGNSLTIADISLPSLPIGPLTLTNVTINGTGSFDCTGKILSLSLKFVSGNIVVAGFPVSIAGQSFSGTFTK